MSAEIATPISPIQRITHLDLPDKPVRRVTHLDLPDTDDIPLENTLQPNQMALLTDSLIPFLEVVKPDGNYQIGQDMGIYWRLTDPPLNGCKSPDWCYIPDVPRMLDGIRRRSFVMWDEGARPLIVMEFVSRDGRVEHDDTPNTGKFWVYRHGIGAPYYVIHDAFRGTLEVYQLHGREYEQITPDANGRYPIPEMGLSIGHWTGFYRGDEALWVRFFTPNGRLLPALAETAEMMKEAAETEKQRAEAEKQRAEAEKQRAEAATNQLQELLKKLREQGIDPEAL